MLNCATCHGTILCRWGSSGRTSGLPHVATRWRLPPLLGYGYVAATHSASGTAAGYHFQVQRALLDLTDAADENAAISIETLDDLTLSESERGTVLTLEQLKHSIHPGSLTDASRPWWDTLGVWMDLTRGGTLRGGEQLTLISTHEAPPGSAAALLRTDNDRDVDAALTLLLEAAVSSKNAETAAPRQRFAEDLDSSERRHLLQRIRVVDGAPDIGEFRAALGATLRFALPAQGQDSFLDQVIGMWERRAVDLLLRRRTNATKAEMLAEITRIRDEYTQQTLPTADVAENVEEVILQAYEQNTFVHQLGLIKLRHERIQMAISSIYHRAFAQRAKWLEDGVLGPGQLSIWEGRLVDEWNHAYQQMLDEIAEEPDMTEVERAGRTLYNRQQASDRVKLLDSSDYFINRGTQHGLADVPRIGWHRDYRQRLQETLGSITAGRAAEDAYKATLRDSAGES